MPQQPGSTGHKLLWFLALYAASIVVVFAVAGLLKAVLPH